MSTQRTAWLWFAAVLALAAGILLWDLGSGQWRTWDEGLYARFGHNALEHGRYLVAVDEQGEYFRRFSKPPMSLWLTAASFSAFGTSVASLRLPFALGMLATIAAAFGWGRRIGGLPMAVSWALGLALCAGATRWGRHACIEPLFAAGMLGGLAAYHASLDAQGSAAKRWAAAAGLAFAFAFMTKQLAVGLGVLPILIFEVWRRDRDALPRLALALGIPTAVALLWFGLAAQATDGAVFDVLVDRGVRRRMSGFETGQNARTLNELSGVLAEVSSPLPWPLGVAGLALLAVTRPRAELRRPSASMLLPLSFVTAVLVLENLSRSMLPWYALHVLIPVTGGAAWCVAAAARRTGRAPLAVARTGLGWATVAAAAVVAAQALLSQLNVALVAGGLLVVAVASARDALRVVALLAAGLTLLGGRLRDPELNPPPQPFSPLMHTLRDASSVAVDRNTGLPELGMRGLFGPDVTRVKRAPWPTTKFDAYVTAAVVPTEFEAPEGVTLHRTAGASAFVGTLDRRVWSRDALAQMLERGPVTFEAEHLGATEWNTALDDPDASGGRLRGFTRFRNEQAPKLPLSIGPKVPLPAGRYDLDVWLDWRCPAKRSERTAVQISAGIEGRKLVNESLPCDAAPGEMTPQRFSFELRDPAVFNMRVGYRFGTVLHDKTVLTRRPD
ncbi:MAG: glycosyltransferase family 39 protein [Myxococcota bacterium]